METLERIRQQRATAAADIERANRAIPVAVKEAQQAGMSMEAIAKALGLSRQGLYWILAENRRHREGLSSRLLRSTSTGSG